MECLDCGKEMVWQNDWELEDADEESVILTDYVCPNEDCELHVSVYRKVKNL